MDITAKLKALGPGLLWAGAAIGVSHLVQSTRAGAIYGFEMVYFIIFINLFKYPFFEFGPRYASSTGESLLHGYNRMGKWSLVLYFVLTIATMFTLIAAVTAVTAGLFSQVFSSLGLDEIAWTLILLIVGGVIVSFGRYSVLDKAIKLIIIVLAISTIVAVVAAFSGGYNPNPEFAKHFVWEFGDIALLIAFAGWMPSAIDISVWHSEWTIAKIRESGHHPKLKDSLFDFNVGYIGTALLSLCFLSLGALVMYGSGESFSPKGTAFAGQLISLFTSSLGGWAYLIIAIAALATMLSTTLTCLDAYPRILPPTIELLFPKVKSKIKSKTHSLIWLLITVLGGFLMIRFFMSSMRFMVDLATTLSFITAPILGYMNYKVVTGKNVPEENRPPKWLRILSWIGLIVLGAFSVYFIVWKFSQ